MDELFFFFSSRRRHTRCLSDWRSDVCSSDLDDGAKVAWSREASYRLPACDRLARSEEHTSELQSLRHLVCRLLLEKKQNIATAVLLIHSHDKQHATLIHYTRK